MTVTTSRSLSWPVIIALGVAILGTLVFAMLVRGL
jgi:hypothetical protein